MTAPVGNFDFDFDEWARLARAEPETFERRRSELIEEIIGDAPVHLQQRLRGLQFRVEMERRRSRTPYAACLRLSRLMWEAFLGDEGLRDRLVGLARGISEPQSPESPASAETCVVLPFRPRPELAET
jgi:hypothetical protein